jgi:hypothetical protein
MCFGTCKSLVGNDKTEPTGIYPFCFPQKGIFVAINSTGSGADFRPRVLSLHVLFTPHSLTFNHPIERKELCLLHYETVL